MNKFSKPNGHHRTRGQAFAEFALIVPLLFLLITGIIEFGYAFYTWAAIGEVARLATRYATTGQYDSQYCDEAGAALGYATLDLLDGTADCKIPSNVSDFEIKTAQLQDWARMPSINDAAMRGASIGLLFDPGVSGNYLQFLLNPATYDPAQQPGNGFSQTYKGNPTVKGFLNVNICTPLNLDPNPRFYDNLGTVESRYNGVCVVDNEYIDQGGGPGERIRVTVTYNHPMIIPFFNSLWPYLKLSTTQDAIVEKYRITRMVGLSSGISTLAVWTNTPLPTNTPAPTAIPPTATATPTLTPTPNPCTLPSGGNGLLGKYYAFYGSPNTNPFVNLVYTRTDSTINFDWGTNSPITGSVPVDNFRIRWTGQVYPPYPGDYDFYTWSDDGVRLYVDGILIIDHWSSHGATKDTSDPVTLNCAYHDIVLEYYDNTGNAQIKLGWSNGNIGNMLPIQQKYLFSPIVTPQFTSTYQTPTRTLTSTPKPTNTPKPPTSTRTATVYQSPVNTSTSAPVVATSTNTRTRTPTSTNTPRPTCGILPDAGGCTPIP